MPTEDFSYPSTGDLAAPAVTLSIFANSPEVRRELRADAEIAGFSPHHDGALVDAIHDPGQELTDCVLLHCEDMSPVDCAGMLALDARLAEAGSRVLVWTPLEALEDVYACIGQCRPQILVAPGRAERVVALGRMMVEKSVDRVRELEEADREALARLTEQVAQIAAQIDRLASGEPRAFRLESPAGDYRAEGEDERRLIRPPRPPLPDPRLVRQIIRQRQLRGQVFDGELFADPAWDILLDLTAARAEHTRVSVTSLCIASGVPATTALRWISQMTDAGLLERVEDESDRRRAFIQLSDKAAEAMARYFAELGKDAKSLV
jgi:hypothetical protein